MRIDDPERLRLESILNDRVTGLTLHPFADLRSERVANLGIVYLQLGRFSGVEGLYGWEVYDRILKLCADSLRADLAASPLRSSLLSTQFTGCDGFYLLFGLTGRPDRRGADLDKEVRRLRDGVVRRLRQSLGRTSVDLMTVHATSLQLPDDPRVRPSRHVVRGMHEAARLVGERESRDRQALVHELKDVLSEGRLHPVYQPVLDIQTRSVMGYEALIRGPVGSALEAADNLFAAARQSGLELELEQLCLDTIFRRLPRRILGRKLFVNASSRLLTHAVFLDDRNLTGIRRAHPGVVVEISEKEVVRDYVTFRGVLERLRASGLQIAIDDAGSGYSGLESILQMRPEYIKVANSIVHNLHTDIIKREIITALSSLGRQINATIVAEGIEHPDELRSLLELGIGYGQGFLLGRPSARIAA